MWEIARHENRHIPRNVVRRKHMETRIREITAKGNRTLKIGVIPGHFATNHSHVNYYVDLTNIKCQHRMAQAAAEQLADAYRGTPIDTIICLEGTEMLGAFLAQELTQNGGGNVNSGNNMAVLTPELNINNQMLFRDNMQKMIWGKNVLLLIASVSTGKTINRSMECLQYYNGNLVGVGAVFSAIESLRDLPIHALFTPEDLPGYETCLSTQCKMCHEKKKLDALVNSYGYSKI